MNLRVRALSLATGGILIAVLHQDTAESLDIHLGDRIGIKSKQARMTAIVDITNSSSMVRQNEVGLFSESLMKLNVRNQEQVEVSFEEKPLSVQYIHNKLDGKILSESEIFSIIKDLVEDKLSEVELTFFVAACFAHPLRMSEITALTKAMVSTGEVLKIDRNPIVDVHSIGGVAGNRTTMIIVPIIAAAGLTIPKTSSRAITSPSGTADTMEVFCRVSFSISELKQIVNDTNGCIIWGGSLNLAPADDRIIKIEHPLRIDAEGQLLASIMSKKASVGATHLLIEIPYGQGLKVADKHSATHLKERFMLLARNLHIKLHVVLAETKGPIGRGIGPGLEAIDVLNVLRNHPIAPADLRERSLSMAGNLLEMIGKAKAGKGFELAKSLLESGKAYEKFVHIVLSQKGRPDFEKHIPIGTFTGEIRSEFSGRVKGIDNSTISKIARQAGAPLDKGAGLYVLKQVGDFTTAGEPLFRIYAQNKGKLESALEAARKSSGYNIQAFP